MAALLPPYHSDMYDTDHFKIGMRPLIAGKLHFIANGENF